MSKKPPPADFDDNPEWTEEDFTRARPADEVHPPHVAAALVKNKGGDRKSTRLNSSHIQKSRMPSSA